MNPAIGSRVLAGGILALLPLTPACNKDYPNPFGTGAINVPPSRAALVYTTSAWASRPGGGREIYSIEADGKNPTRLSFCNEGEVACDTPEASLSPDGLRAIERRTKAGVAGSALLSADLNRHIEAELLPATSDVNGIDWAASPATPVIIYSSIAQAGGLEDLWRADPNGQNAANLTQTPAVRERRGRVDPATQIATFERIEGSGKAEVWVFLASAQQQRVSPPGPGGAPLPNTPYLVGSDTDPTFSPDSKMVVFRHLTAVDASGAGNWDIITANLDGTSPVTIASGPQFRGAPDWGPLGIVFPEIDSAAGVGRLVLITPAGQRQVLLSQGSGYLLSNPRWLRQVMP
jgi:Tol biopolymer transport system component